MATIIFDTAQFRATFPAYASVTVYPDAMLEALWQDAQCYLSADVYSSDVACVTRMLNLMVAHLLYLQDEAANGGSAGIVTSASEDKISVTIAAPPFGTSEFVYWLQLSPWGQQVAAYLKKMSAGGMYIGGRGELSAFRKARGLF